MEAKKVVNGAQTLCRLRNWKRAESLTKQLVEMAKRRATQGVNQGETIDNKAIDKKLD